ncbi:bifunctional 5,10-methylenetetrahydrofolate dehydrogenase/5,10-methenyltetrahydrofolate cyclohydrolase [Candidatus Peregrinibacteria bacterium]|nr:bifunctional 5,10-methylenetetrahydrofolate dehydrogenase/5,10-methenyltetrahydrofolate cyclohydrolase [Candidatus Peregrinibacteria bacterium]
MILLDGKALSTLLIDSVREKAVQLKPALAVILVGEDPASLTYVRNKQKACERAGIRYLETHFPVTVSQEELLRKIDEVNRDPAINGLIVQIPLPPHIRVPLVIRAIDPKKDVDGFHAYNIGKTVLSPEFEDLPPATPLGIVKLLDHYKIPIQGQEAVVVGHSNIVGKPISIMMLNRNATVTTCHIFTRDLKAHTKRADILIVAAGKPKLITADMVKKDAVVIDVGITRMKDGTLQGDVDFEAVSKKASYITPVPGGVGPMTVAALILNTIRATERQRSDE